MKCINSKAFQGFLLLTAFSLLACGCKPPASPTLEPQEPTQALQSTALLVEPTENSIFPTLTQSIVQQAYPDPSQIQAAQPNPPYPEPVQNTTQPNCPSATNGEGEMRLDIYGVCFLYPAGFTASTEAISNGVTVLKPSIDSNTEPLQVVFDLQVKPAEGRSLDEAMGEIFEQNPDAPLEKTALKVNGFEAYRIEGVPGKMVSRMLVAVVNSQVYLMTFSPMDEAFAQAKPDVEMLWDTITQSIQFYRPQP